MPDYQELRQQAVEVMPGGVSHGMRASADGPVMYVRGKGSRVWDPQGREYVDYLMGSAALLLGHAHDDVVDALARQAAEGAFFAKTHPLEVEWARLVRSIVPSAEQVRFTGSGSESTMLAARVARAYTGKPCIMRFEGHYHGWSDVLLTGSEAPFDVPPGAGVAPHAAAGLLSVPTDLAEVERLLRERDDIAAVIVEPSGANWGCVPVPLEFCAGLRDITERHGVLLIMDEIITGFRWSPGGVQALLGIRPDLTTLAKILTGGMPGGAVAGRAEVMSVLAPDAPAERRVVHKGTFNGAPIVAAAAVATLRHVATGAPQRHASAVAASIRDGMRQVMRDNQVAGAVYGAASAFHVYFGRTAAPDSVEGLSPAAVRGVPKATVAAYQEGMRRHGVNIMSYLGGVTSSAHDDADVAFTLDAFERTLHDLRAAELLPG